MWYRLLDSVRGLSILSTLLVALSGCSHGLNPPRLTAGSEFDVASARAIREGLQASSLVDLLGPPFLVVPDKDRGETWYYFMRHESSSVMYVFGLIPLRSTRVTATCVSLRVRDSKVERLKVTEAAAKGSTECDSLPAPGIQQLPK